jgi:PAS domain S-box-containing protein
MWIDKRLPTLRQHPVFGWAIAGLLVGLAIALKVLLSELPPFLTLFPAVLLSAFLGGRMVGAVALVVCTLAGAFFVMSSSSDLSHLWQGINIVGFVIVGGLIVFVVSLLDTSVQRLQRERRRLNVALRAGSAAIWEIYPDGQIYWDENFYRLVGLPGRTTAPTTEEFLAMVHPDDRDRMAQARRSMETGETPQLEDEYRVIRPDGSIVWLANHRTWINANGRYFIGFTQDITQRKAAQKQIKLLMGELAHRVKNQYAVILAMVRETNNQSRTKDEMESLVTSRIQALSRSHDLLIHGNWEGADFSELIRSHIDAFGMSDRLSLLGPVVKLSPNAAQYLGLAIHELGTNATKHGAFSRPGGAVHVIWTLSGPTFSLEWREEVNGLDKRPGTTGFGSKVLQRLTPAALSGSGRITFSDRGLVWSLECPIEAISAVKPG